MTNGEKLRQTFPRTIFIQRRSAEGKLEALMCSDEWWEAEYKEETEGRWEHHYIRPGVYADLFWYCSACGGKTGYHDANMYDFCPNCGAHMREEKT